jgi:hypothetical protein
VPGPWALPEQVLSGRAAGVDEGGGAEEGEGA